MDLWAEALASGTPLLTQPLVARGIRLLREAMDAGPELSDRDRIAGFWLAGRLLGAEWTSGDEERRLLAEWLAAGARGIATLGADARALNALDAAFLLDASVAAPAARVAR
ncbi:MAG TPA: hypothetical protein VFS08_12175, partial [Gemmatimonadaceae bacterium]|nr:hypothetical protein [Gemmatimonadaceae bacterium]